MKKNILLGMSEELYIKIEEYKTKNKIKTRTKAILQLIEKG